MFFFSFFSKSFCIALRHCLSFDCGGNIYVPICDEIKQEKKNRIHFRSPKSHLVLSSYEYFIWLHGFMPQFGIVIESRTYSRIVF